jgi:hypothetical protein
MSEVSSEQAQYTVGFSIAVLLIVIIAVWRLIAKQIKKWVSSGNSCENPVEIPVVNEHRQISSAPVCVQIAVECDQNNSKSKRRKLERSVSETTSKPKKKTIEQSKRRKSFDSKSSRKSELKFFAGFSHKYGDFSR